MTETMLNKQTVWLITLMAKEKVYIMATPKGEVKVFDTCEQAIIRIAELDEIFALSPSYSSNTNFSSWCLAKVGYSHEEELQKCVTDALVRIEGKGFVGYIHGLLLTAEGIKLRNEGVSVNARNFRR